VVSLDGTSTGLTIQGSFLPITLEQLARDRGVKLSDKITPCSASWGTTSLSNSSSSVTTRRPSHEDGQCIVYILGVEINTASFAMYTFSLSVLVQTILIISMSGAADHGNYRKRLLLIFAFTGAVATMLFLPVVPKVYLFGSLLAIISNTCFGASFVLLNSFLPLIVRHHPSVQHEASENLSYSESTDMADQPDEEDLDLEESFEGGTSDSTAALLPSDHPDRTLPSAPVPATISPELQLSTKISSNGIGIGYIAAVLVQILGILIVVATNSTTFSLRLVLFFIGLWWLVFSIPPALWLRPRPGPPFPFDSHGRQRRGWASYIGYAWSSLGKTVMRARKLKDVLLFLAAWFLLSDGIATVSGTAVLFAKTQLGMKTAALGLINVIATISGVCGAFGWSAISRWFRLKPSQTIIACVCLFEIIPLYGLLGFIPAIKRLEVIGLQQPWEMYPLGAIYGFVLGGLSSYCRSLFGELIPPGSEAAFYALYAITDKGSSIFGPAIVGAITDRFGEIRPAFVFLAVIIAFPLPLMMMVDVERGKEDAADLARELEGRKAMEGEGGHEREVPNVPTIQLIDEEADDGETT
jgi:MFS transporter, UMF1 family